MIILVMAYDVLILKPMMTRLAMVYMTLRGFTCHVVQAARAIVASLTTLLTS